MSSDLTHTAGGASTDGAPAASVGLQRVLGVPALFSAAYANVGSSIYYALGLVAGFALGLTPIAFLVSGIIFVATALTYAEGTTSHPEAGGASSFARYAFNEVAAFMTAWAQLMNFIITMAISAFFVPHYLGVFWEPLKSSPGDVIGGILVIVVLASLNIYGIKETAALQVTLALADFGTQLLLALLGMVLLFDPGVLISNVHLGIAPTWGDFLLGITLSMIAYTGIETISNLAEETRDPVRSVPRAIGWVVAAVLSLYILLPVIALSALPVTKQPDGSYATLLGLPESQQGFAGDPFVGMVEQFPLPAHWMETVLLGYVGVLAAVILFVATNSGIIGVSRLSYSMAQYRQVPEALRRLHPTRLTPYVSITVFSLIGCVLLLPPAFGWLSGAKENEVLGNLYAFGAMLSFSIAHLSIIKTRLRGDDPVWKAPFNMTVRGKSIPMFAVLGLTATAIAWFVQIASHPLERVIGLGWMAIGPVVYVLYRRRHGIALTITERAPLVIQAPSIHINYHNIMVPLLSGRLDQPAMVVACKLAAERGASILVAAAMEVPQSLPLHAQLGEMEARVNEQLDLARRIGDEYGVKVVTRVLRDRRADTALLAEALRRETQLIVLGVNPRRHLGISLVGRTNERILQRSPVRVVLVREHDDYIGTSATR